MWKNEKKKPKTELTYPIYTQKVCTIAYKRFIQFSFFSLSGILSEVREGLDINNEQAGLLQTAFVASFMIFAPLFGYLGDRCNRKWVMVVGITIWSVATLLGSFMEDFYR